MKNKTYDISFVNIFEYSDVEKLNDYINNLDTKYISFIKSEADKFNNEFFDLTEFDNKGYKVIDYNKDKFQLFGKIYDLDFLRLFDLTFDSLTDGFDIAFLLKVALRINQDEVLYFGNKP